MAEGSFADNFIEMSVMILLLGASLIVAVIFLIAFIWSVRNGQYDDDFSPSHKILFEDQPQKKQS